MVRSVPQVPPPSRLSAIFCHNCAGLGTVRSLLRLEPKQQCSYITEGLAYAQGMMNIGVMDTPSRLVS